MRLHYIQHVGFEGLGSIEAWANKNGATISVTRLYAGEPLPDCEEIDWLVVMGGPMNIYEEDKFPWLVTEKSFIYQAIEAGKIVLGVCLGAQLIADALGAKIYTNEHKEIGWFPIQMSSKVPPALQQVFPKGLEVMHWHGDTFELPQEAIRLASSTVCKNQGFIYQGRVAALQFHLETTRKTLSSLIINSRDEMIDAPYIQTEEAMLADESRFQKINMVMAHLLDHLKVSNCPS